MARGHPWFRAPRYRMLSDMVARGRPESRTPRCRMLCDMVARGRFELQAPRCRMLACPPLSPPCYFGPLHACWPISVTGGSAVPGGLQGRGTACWLTLLPRPFPLSLPVLCCVTWWPTAVGTTGLCCIACWRALLGRGDDMEHGLCPRRRPLHHRASRLDVSPPACLCGCEAGLVSGLRFVCGGRATISRVYSLPALCLSRPERR